MRNSFKSKINLILFITLLVTMFTTTIYATAGDIVATADVTPPRGKIEIKNVIKKDNLNFVPYSEIEVEIIAKDDSEGEIKYFISSTEILDTTEISEDSWNTYQDGKIEKVTLDSTKQLNTVYLVLKDEYGNTSLIYNDENVEYEIEYNANAVDATMFDVTVPTKTYYGMPFMITNDSPTRANHYFIGWSTNPNATVPSFKRGEIIPANLFVGGTKTIILYAVWKQDGDGKITISEVAEVGDYIELPIAYDNVNGSPYTGWRVISKDIDLDGNESIGTINVVSAGTPLTYYHADNSTTSVEALTTNFITTQFSDTEDYTYRKNGFSSNKTLFEIFNNVYIEKNADGTPKVRAMLAEDIYRVTNYTSMSNEYSMDLVNDKYDNLFVNESNYYLASKYDETNLWDIAEDGYVKGYNQHEYGIRPVVQLKAENLVTGTGILDEWEIENPKYTITYDANGGEFDTGTTNVVTYKEEDIYITRISKTTNVNDDGTDNGTGYGDNQEKVDIITIPKATELEITITYQTQGNDYDWVCIYDENTTPDIYNYENSISGKLGGDTKTTKTYIIPGDTVQIYFHSDNSNDYYGYYAEIKGHGINRTITEGEYKEPTKKEQGLWKLIGWNTDKNATTVEYNLGAENIPEENTTLYAVWVKLMDLIPSKANAPVLGKDINGIYLMEAVYWSDENATTEITATEFTEDMYNYVIGNGEIDSKETKWANAKTIEDGSYWVWLPRYAYKITYINNVETQTSEEKQQYGNIDILFMDGTSNTHYRDVNGNAQPLPEGYKVHPAFQSMTEAEVTAGLNSLGKWDSELEGIWVAKYEASQGSSGKMESKPSISNFNTFKPGSAYSYSKGINSNLNSHLMKNSEWGAITYLTHSAYGRNGNELGYNGSNQYSYRTGGGPGEGVSTIYNSQYSYDSSTFPTTYAWNTTQGKLASTTGNIYGVYDMSGGNRKVTAAYINNSSASSRDSYFVNDVDLRDKQTYPVGSSDSSAENYNASADIYGDAIYETSTNYSGSTAWFHDVSTFPGGYNAFFERGLNGMFYFSHLNGSDAYNHGFYPVLCVPKTCKITYDANEGDLGEFTGIEYITREEEYTITSSQPTRDRYTFLGWSTNPEATESEYLPGDKLMVYLDIELYAVWKKNDTVVTYDANGGSFDTGTTNEVVYEYVKATITKISKTSNVSEDGTTADTSTGYGNNQSIIDIITIPGAKELEVTITYQTQSYGDDWVCLYDDVSITPSNSNYSSSMTGKLYSTTKTTKTYTITGDTVQIYFYSNNLYCSYYGYYAEIKGETFVPIVKTGEYKEPTRDSCTLLGWSTAADATEAEYELGEIAVPDVDNFKLYAVWKPDNVIAYDANGGTFDTGITNEIVYGYSKGMITKTSKTSNVSEDGTTANTSTGYGNNQSITDVITILGAKELEVTITYQTESIGYDWVCLYDTSVTPNNSNYSSSITGKLGGTTKKTETYTIEGDTVQIYFKSDGSSCGFYGYYAEVKCKGNMMSISSGEYKEPTRNGYKLLGWSTNKNATEAEYELGIENTPDVDSATLYAVWKLKEDTIANAPILGTDGNGNLLMNAVYWSDENASQELTATSFTREMYNYEMGDGVTDTKQAKWANAKTTSDGSYWVWIPRYAYKITYYTDDTKTVESTSKTQYGKIDVIFMKGTSNTEYINVFGETKTLPQGYIVHPAFQKMTTTQDLTTNPLGKWDTELEGIWVAKYEASRGSSGKPESKPSAWAWHSITIGDSYTACENMHSTLGSHQMKNSEWGAVAYLAYSAYGRNGNEVSVNECTDQITGAGPNEGASLITNKGYSYSSSTFANTYAWNTTRGKLASTTGNIYGVYDMSGGTFEYVSSYVNNGDDDLRYGESMINSNNLRNKQIYAIGSTDSREDYYSANSGVYGDAIYETSISGSSSNGWCDDLSSFLCQGLPFFARGCKYAYSRPSTDSGIFAFYDTSGLSNGDNTFRPVLCFSTGK